jgi:hypothetical protein
LGIESKNIKLFGKKDIVHETKKKLPNKADHNWNSPAFGAKARELLGKRARDVNFHNGFLRSQECYWTKGNNALKTIQGCNACWEKENCIEG